MHSVTPRSAKEYRRHARYPLRLPARVLCAGMESAECTIENFSRTGMSVTIQVERAIPKPRQGDHDLVTVVFTLPAEGRPVRGRALLKHARLEGNFIHLGLFFEQCNPAIMHSLLNASRRRAGSSRPAPAAAGGEVPVAAAIGSEERFPTTTTRDAPIADLVPDVCEQFLHHAQERLLERYSSERENPEAFFRGLVAIQARRPWLEERLLRCRTPSVSGLRRWFARIVAELEVSGAVEEELCQVFEHALDVVTVRTA